MALDRAGGVATLRPPLNNPLDAMTDSAPISPHAAMIYLMVMIAAADRDMTDVELGQIGHIVKLLPAFRDFDLDRLPETAQEVAVLVSTEDGMERTLELIAAALPRHLHETAYALACEVAAVDDHLRFEEMRLLQLARRHLAIDRLVAVAIERAIAARFASLAP